MKIKVNICEMDRRELRLLIERYFDLGFVNQVIFDSLKNRHGITTSLSTLKRRLRDYGLKRRGLQIEDQELREIMYIKKLFIHYGVNSQEKIQGCEQLMVLNRAEVCFIKAVLGTIFLPNRPLAYIPSTCQQKLGP